MKLIDFDKKFNRRMAEYLEKHAGERSEEEWEDVIAAAYRKFGDTVLSEIGTTPRRYFADMTDGQLTETLKEYLLQDVSVPDLLCEELERRGAVPETLALLRETDEDLVLYAIRLIGADPRAAERYAQMLAEDAYDEHVKAELTETLREMADDATEALLQLLHGPARAVGQGVAEDAIQPLPGLRRVHNQHNVHISLCRPAAWRVCVSDQQRLSCGTDWAVRCRG